MLKLEQPNYTYEQTIENCCSGITGNNLFLNKIYSNAHFLHDSAESYFLLAPAGELYRILPTSNQLGLDPNIAGQLKKSDLLKLYNIYFVGQKKPGRIIYDSLMAGANDKCPFCGGIGRPRNLDHYLPKAHYPQFSILPINLLPSCRDCNMDGKGDNFATSEEEHLLHPYLDNDRYFNEQWVHSRYNEGMGGEPGFIDFFVDPPQHWNMKHKRRVQKHFNDFNLGLRYSKEAGPRLVIYLDQIKMLLGITNDIETSKKIILQPIIDSSPFVNHWDRVMCATLMHELLI